MKGRCSHFKILFLYFSGENWGKMEKISVKMVCLRAKVRVWGFPHSNYKFTSPDRSLEQIFGKNCVKKNVAFVVIVPVAPISEQFPHFFCYFCVRKPQ